MVEHVSDASGRLYALAIGSQSRTALVLQSKYKKFHALTGASLPYRCLRQRPSSKAGVYDDPDDPDEAA